MVAALLIPSIGTAFYIKDTPKLLACVARCNPSQIGKSKKVIMLKSVKSKKGNEKQCPVAAGGPAIRCKPSLGRGFPLLSGLG